MKLLVVLYLLAAVSFHVSARPNAVQKSNGFEQILQTVRSKPKAPLGKPESSSDKISVAIIVQKSKDLIAPLLQMNKIAPDIVKSLQQTKDWVGYYTYWEFDDKTHDYVTKTPFVEELPTEITNMISSRQNAPFICKDLKVFDTVIDVLSDPDTTRGAQLFLFVEGGTVFDLTKTRQVFDLVDKKKATINIIQSPVNSCFDNDDLHVKTISTLASYSGGFITYSGDGNALKALPLQYDAKMAIVRQYNKCHKGIKEWAYSPAGTWSISFYLSGDLESDPKISGPGKFQVQKIYGSSTDSLYVVTAKNAKSPDDKLELGSWTIKFRTQDQTQCGLRIDTQTNYY
ncbi:hypothetical protein M3Y97_00914500 [Aphelenchoides bicaudatus]|nr:hypothetical protein M3Y97_00914500 [Aphelenchoides bicaudatus]